MKKNAPKILAIFLLTVIAVLMVVAGSGTVADLFKDKDTDVPGSSANVEGDSPPPAEEPDQGSGNVTEDETNNVFFPVPPEASAIYAYTQSLWSESGMELNNALSTSEGLYVIVTHASDSGVLATEGKRISVVRADNDGTLVSAVHLASRGEDIRYLGSRLTSAGLVVVATDGERSYVHTISTDLKKTDLIELPAFNAATVFALNEGYLLLGSGASNTVYKIIDNAVAASTTLQSGEIREVYDFGTYYMLVLNGISGYSAIKIGVDLNHISTATVAEKQLLAINPVVSGGVQKFLVAEKTANGVYIARYGADFSAAEADRVSVGLAEDADVFMNGSSAFVLLHATTDRLYIVDSELGFTASSTTVLQGISDFHDCETYADGFLTLYSAGDTLTLADVRNDGTSVTRSIAIGTQKAFIVRMYDGTSAVVCSVENGVKIIGL